MTQKTKLNAAEVIKHMSEKELKQYNISLEKEGATSPSKVPAWFKPYAENINILMKERNQLPAWFKPYAENINILMKERNQLPAWFQEFKKENDARWVEQEEFNRQISKSFSDFANQMLEFVKEQKKFNISIMKRLDNLVAKNNLKE